ncbi:hypothetical protein D9M68_852040 [compost metagenome]
MTEEFSGQQLRARQGVGQQQHQGALRLLTDDGVIGQQQSNQRNQERRQGGKTDHGGRQAGETYLAGNRGAECRQPHCEHAEDHPDGDHPAIAQTVDELLAGDTQQRTHDASARWLKCT